MNVTDSTALLLWRPALAAVDKYAIVYGSGTGTHWCCSVSFIAHKHFVLSHETAVLRWSVCSWSLQIQSWGSQFLETQLSISSTVWRNPPHTPSPSPASWAAWRVHLSRPASPPAAVSTQTPYTHKHHIDVNIAMISNKQNLFFLQVLPGIQMKQKTSKPGMWLLAALLCHGHRHRSLRMDTYWSTRPKMKNLRWEKFYSTVE